MRTVLVAVPLLLVLAACTQRPPGDPGHSEPDPLRGKTFIATTVTEDGTTRDLVGELSIEFTDDGRLVARPGCNILEGQVDTSNGTLTLAGWGTTDMACDQPRMDQDTFVSGVLNKSPSWRLAGDRLTITSRGTTFD